jgi:hypothetical protein
VWKIFHDSKESPDIRGDATGTTLLAKLLEACRQSLDGRLDKRLATLRFYETTD